MLDYLTIKCSFLQEKERREIGVHRQISFRSFKKYSVDEYANALDRVIFPKYEKYSKKPEKAY